MPPGAKPNLAADALTPPWIDFTAPQLSPIETLFWVGGGGNAIPETDVATQAKMAAAQGDALTAQGNFRAALARFHEAVFLCPNSPEYHYRLAGAAEKAGQNELLERHLHEAVRLEPCFAPAHYSLGKWYRLAGKLDRAIYHTAITVALAPRDSRYVSEHGIVLVMTDQAQAAWELIEPLITDGGIVNRWIAALYARIAPMIGHLEQALAVVEKALEAPDLTPARDSKPLLQYAAASLLDSLARYDEAFKYAYEANELVRKNSPPHNPEGHTQWVSNKINYFTKERLNSLPRATHGNRRPVFIVGMPRSGTSLVEQILASHPDVFAAGELETLSKLPTAQRVSGWTQEDPYPMSLETLSSRAANELAQRYLSEIEGLDSHARYVTDKMPSNFLGLELVEMLLPGCKVIQCFRSPLDGCLSCYMTNFAIANEFKLDLGHIGAYQRDYRRLMDHWKKVLTLPILEVRYEDLVLDTEGQVRRILNFLDLPWDDACLNFHKSRRPVRTASEDQVRRPIYTSSVGRWKHYESHLGPLFAALGRSTVGTSRARSDGPEKNGANLLASTQTAAR
jgi:tetratricopeptide (TPR) repeat protein